MKILFVNRKCGFFGGVEQNVADTAAGLRQAGHRCTLAYGEMTEMSTEAYAGHFDAVTACHELGAVNAEALAAIMAREMPDVVYLHKVPQLAPLLPALRECPTMMMVHDHDLCCPRRHKYYAWTGRVCHRPMGLACYADAAFLARGPRGWRLVSLREKAGELRAYRGLALLLVASAFMRDELLGNGFTDTQVRVLAPQVRRQAAEPTPVPPGADVLYVGQLIRGKGVDLLLEAMARHVPAARLRIVGAGNAEARLRAQVQALDLQERVQFLGWVDHARLETLYRAARVVVVPSRWPEPFGMVGVEAMSYARPLVAFAVGGIPDWLHDGENGIAVPEQNVAALGQAIQRLVQDDALAGQLGAQGYLMYTAEYNFTHYIHSLAQQFTALARESSAR